MEHSQNRCIFAARKMSITMQRINKYLSIVFPCLVLTGCLSGQADGNSQDTNSQNEAMQGPNQTVHVPEQPSEDDGKMIRREDCYSLVLEDADGDVCNSARYILYKNEGLVYHYQRVGCTSDTCRQEFVTFSAVQYPQDSVLQVWMSEVLADYYYDVTRQLDIIVNGTKTEDNGDGEMVLQNVGCRPYQGILGDGGKSMFDYYQARVWVIGKGRDLVHGPSGRYGCAIYRCWQSDDVASYFVGYSTDEPQWPVHYVCSFDRNDGHRLDVTDIIRAEYIAELQDLVADAARSRHYRLLHSKNCELAIESEPCDYSSVIDIKAVALGEAGLIVSTGALAFDQWASATHIMTIPYAKVNNLLEERYRR